MKRVEMLFAMPTATIAQLMMMMTTVHDDWSIIACLMLVVVLCFKHCRVVLW